MKESVQKIKSINGVQWNGTYAVPLLDANFAPESALKYSDEVSGVGSYADGQLYMEYRQEHTTIKGTDFFKPASINAGFKNVLTSSEQSLLEGGSVVMERDQIIEWSQTGSKVDSINFKSGKLRFQIDNNIQHNLTFTVILLGGKPDAQVSGTLQMPWKGSPSSGLLELDLKGVTLDLSRGPLENNQLRIRIRALFNNDGVGAINGSDALNWNVSSSDLSWNRVHGIFSDKPILAKSDNIRLGALSADYISNSTIFRDARLKINWKNSYGIPLKLDINSLGFIFGDGSRTLINGGPASVKVRPAANSGGKPAIEKDSVYLTAQNSNVATLVEQQAHYLFWNDAFFTDGGNQTQTIWAESTSTFTISLELPLYIATKGIKATASADLNGSWKEDATNMDWIIFRLQVKNDLPVSLGVQAYFMDEQNQILDSLISPYRILIKSAEGDSTGNAIATSEETIDIKLDKSKINKIINARRLYAEAYGNTAEIKGKPIGISKIKQGQELQFKIGIHSGLTINKRF